MTDWIETLGAGAVTGPLSTIPALADVHEERDGGGALLIVADEAGRVG